MSLPVSLTDYTFHIIREHILTGKYPPGSKLLTETISKELGVSRTPVIAAINRLVAEDLAINVPRHGTIVRQFSKRDVREILEARYMIEFFAAPKVIEFLNQNLDKLAEMESLLAQFDTITSLSYSDANKLDSHFHTLFMEMSGNHQLVKLYKQNWSVGITYHLFYMANLPLEDQLADYQDHKNIVAAIKAKDIGSLMDVLTRNKESNLRLIDEKLPFEE